jgi:hypothetical protein
VHCTTVWVCIILSTNKHVAYFIFKCKLERIQLALVVHKVGMALTTDHPFCAMHHGSTQQLRKLAQTQLQTQAHEWMQVTFMLATCTYKHKLTHLLQIILHPLDEGLQVCAWPALHYDLPWKSSLFKLEVRDQQIQTAISLVVPLKLPIHLWVWKMFKGRHVSEMHAIKAGGAFVWSSWLCNYYCR